ncbi:hypothetical protein [Megamonas hypermegale]|uniref:hypothetical protein n=1 Tax=Megamonas hypermegale TaxID=158847 RepID=UPI0026F07815|nr:hypothetical protein [Megamonas hypermegale]
MTEKDEFDNLLASRTLKAAAIFLYEQLPRLEKDPTSLCPNLAERGITEKDYPIMVKSFKLAITMLVEGAKVYEKKGRKASEQ